MSFSSTADKYLIFSYYVKVIQGLSGRGYILYYQLGYKSSAIAMSTWICIGLVILLSKERSQTDLWT